MLRLTTAVECVACAKTIAKGLDACPHCSRSIGLLLYICYHMAKPDSLLFAQVDEFGKVAVA